MADDILAAASELRIWIDYSLAQQMNARSSRQLFLGLRKRLEDRGILVLMFDRLRVEELRGLALVYDYLPIIGINSRDRWPAKCFSLLHELVHLFLRQSTICNQIGIEADDAEEVYCNAVAGEFLFPRSCASRVVFDGLDPHDVEALEKVALRYNVSRDVVARRLRDCDFLSKVEYEELLALFARELVEENELRKRSREVGAEPKFFQDYERAVADKHGSLYCEVISHGLSMGLLGERDVCSALNVSADRLEKVFVEAFK